jgi:hypothetical protein
MDGRLINATNGPTALVGVLAEGGDLRSKGKTNLQLWGKARDSLDSVPDALGRLAQLRLPRRSGGRSKSGPLKLARNLGAAASITLFAVDMISEMRNAAEGRRSSGR